MPHRVSCALALLSGVLLALSFPKYGHPSVAWVALVPLLVALSGWTGTAGRLSVVSPRRAFLLGVTSGCVYFAGTVYWTGEVVRQFGGLSVPLAVLAIVLLSAYLALYPALAAWIAARGMARFGMAGVPLFAASWVAAEYLRGVLFGGFPWVPVGNSQVTTLSIAQLASVTGVYGLSALVALVNACLAMALIATGRARWSAVAAAAVLVIGVGAWGSWRIGLGELARDGTLLRVGVVQGNIAQEDKWDAAHAPRILNTYMAMSREAAQRGAQALIWPESSTPAMFEEDPTVGQSVRDLARELGVPILFGSDQLERGRPPRLYNAAFLVGPRGTTTSVYRKVHLVPFGEFIPFKDWLFFVSPLVESLAEFAPGQGTVLMPLGTARISTAICYEVVYPALIRDAVLAGSELLTTITNDGWYGHSSAPYQHFALASMRAIEQGRYLVRSANTGISGVIDPYGRIVAQSPIFQTAVLVEEVRLRSALTLYGAMGDVVAYIALAVSVLTVVVSRRAATPVLR